MQTAAEIAMVLGIQKISIDFALCEVLLTRNVAVDPVYLTLEQLQHADPVLENMVLESSPVPPPPWPEELADARRRFNGAFSRIPYSFPGHTLIVAHGDTVAQFVSFSRNVAEDSVYSVPPCSAAGADMLLRPDEPSGKPVWKRTTMLGDILVIDDMIDDDNDDEYC